MPALTQFTDGTGPVWKGDMFPFLFITIACGAVSGFHALIASGTTSKQLANEKHARGVSMGAMLLNTLLAVVAVLAVGLCGGIKAVLGLELSLQLSTLASGLATAWNALFGGNGELVTSGLFYDLIILAISFFALTTLDTCVRLARYTFAELFNPEGKRLKKLEGAQRIFAAPAVGTLMVIVLGCALALLSQSANMREEEGIVTYVIETEVLWGFFGAANLLLAAMALMSLSLWLKQNGKASWMLQAPGLVCLLVALYDLIRRPFGLVAVALYGSAGWLQWLTAALSLVLLVLAALLLIQLLPRLWKKEQVQEAQDDVD